MPTRRDGLTAGPDGLGCDGWPAARRTMQMAQRRGADTCYPVDCLCWRAPVQLAAMLPLVVPEQAPARSCVWSQYACRELFALPAWLIALLVLAGCPESQSAAPQTCAHPYDKCTLASGVLGVCDPVDCAADQKPPCLVCRSQH